MDFEIAASALNSLFASIAIALGFGVSLMVIRRPAYVANRRASQRLCPIGRANAVREDRC